MEAQGGLFKTPQLWHNSAFNTAVIKLPLSTKWEELLFHLVREDQQHVILKCPAVLKSFGTRKTCFTTAFTASRLGSVDLGGLPCFNHESSELQ